MPHNDDYGVCSSMEGEKEKKKGCYCCIFLSLATTGELIACHFLSLSLSPSFFSSSRCFAQLHDQSMENTR